MPRKPRTFEVFSMSFLDSISCGFGAIILLLVLSKIAAPISEPAIIEGTETDVQQLIAVLQEKLFDTPAGTCHAGDRRFVSSPRVLALVILFRN